MVTDRNTTYLSSLSLKRLATAAGKEEDFRNSLEQQLREHGIDPLSAYNNLPPGEVGKAEIVARLVSLARAHGLLVLAPDVSLQKGGTLKIVTPAAANMLQSGHDKMGPG